MGAPESRKRCIRVPQECSTELRRVSDWKRSGKALQGVRSNAERASGEGVRLEING